MKTLNTKAKTIFCELIDKMESLDHLKITNEPMIPLVIEYLHVNISTPIGIGKQYSLCHYFKQNGDQMQDPEMCFIVVDNRTQTNCNIDLVSIVPYMFQQASGGIYQESIFFENFKIAEINHKIQRDHTLFADFWLSNIQQSGYLDEQM
ncbi:DUF6908 domain-containing protein [Flavobacterium sp. UBA4197]|uniref:DUF6908 domain-containing protein n=1 Tax=Flavobacterium sp. UBA4197 TaxID=1946546 RepID=UPI00257EBEDE|nr:hypothetical protein [Flavobacterium sp. UBA4197]